MPDKENLYLCGGTFFTLLTRAINTATRSTTSSIGFFEGVNNTTLMKALVKIYNPGANYFPSNFYKYVSEYRSCQKDSSTYINFSDAILAESYEQRMETEFQSLVEEMASLTKKFINKESKGRWLVRALLELIESIPATKSTSIFYQKPDGRKLTGGELKTESEFCLEVLMLYILLYIAKEVTSNKDGKATYDSWHAPQNGDHTQPIFIGTIGNNEERQVSLVEPSAYKKFVVKAEKTKAVLTTPTAAEPGSGYNYTAYLEAAKKKHGQIKTMLYTTTPHQFYDFYVCNNVMYKERIQDGGVVSYRSSFIQGLDSKKIEKLSNCIVLAGPGGLGKSMMLRHLLLNAAKNYAPGDRVPVFISLKEYDGSKKEIADFIYESINSFEMSIENKTFAADLAAGKYLLLFDGMDEISSAYRGQFETRLSKFVDANSKNLIVVSARPYSDFVSLSRFTVLTLMPFSKSQALELISKLDFEPVAVKNAFYEQLDARLYFSYRAFTGNPLLLTLMLMTYTEHLDVPSRMHIFYSEAYDVLATRHDSHKDTPVHRSLKTGIAKDRFRDYLAEFCAHTYTEEKFELTGSEMDHYFNGLKIKADDEAKTGAIISASDFIDDLTTALCIMFYEGGKYHFIHRSFQEYFCAVFFSKQMDSYLPMIGQFFEENKRGKMQGDQTFEMLYDMIPEKVEKFIFIPYLKALFEACDKEDGYLTFLDKIYYSLDYTVGDVGYIISNRPASYMYNFIAVHNELKESMSQLNIPEEEDFLQTKFVYQCYELNPGETEEDRVWEAVPVDDVRPGYVEEYGEPEEAGCEYVIEMSDLLDHRDQYPNIIEALSSEQFPAKKEYNAIRRYYDELNAKFAEKKVSLAGLFQ